MITTASLTMTGTRSLVPVYAASLSKLRLLVAPNRTSVTVHPSWTRAKVVVT